jgi:hypothetical protein
MGNTMSRVGFGSVLIVVTATLPWISLAQDDTCPNPCVPGAINDPSTFRGSSANQAQEQQVYQQQEAANQQMQQRLDQNYAAYSPNSGGGGGGGVGAAVAASLKSKPLLPAANNPLIGRWQQLATKHADLGLLGALPGVQSIVDGSLGGGCEGVFGKGRVAFTPTQFNWVAPDGHEEILNHVEYHSDGANVIVIPTDSDLPLIFGLPDRDHAVVAFLGCRMEREGAKSTQVVARSAPAGAAAGSAAGQGILKLKVGDMVDGRLSSPPAGTQIFVTSQDPDANLVKAGFTPAPGTPPVEKLFAACNIGHGGNQADCSRGLQAMIAGALGAVSTDPNGEGQTPAVPVGRYYLVGFTPYKGHSLLWHLPVDVKAGANTVTLSSQNGSISH